MVEWPNHERHQPVDGHRGGDYYFCKWISSAISVWIPTKSTISYNISDYDKYYDSCTWQEVLGIAAAAGNTRAYHWLILQIVFADFGSIAAIPIDFTAHVVGCIAWIFLTKLFIGIEPKKRAKYSMPSGIIIMIRGGLNN